MPSINFISNIYSIKSFKKLKVFSFKIFRGVQIVKVEFYVQAQVNISVVRTYALREYLH